MIVALSYRFGDSERTYRHPNTRTRLAWALHDKSEMGDAIARISHTIHNLGVLLALRAPQESHKIIPENIIKTTPQAIMKPLRSLYMNVHRALCEANKHSKRPVSFSICALGDLEQNWNRLDNQTKLRLRLGCVALWLQMHVAAEESRFWIAEVRLTGRSSMSRSINLPLIECLDELPHVDAVSDAEEHHEVGALRNKFDSTDMIHVFAHTNPCRKQQTLREILALEDSCSKLSDWEILKLCLTIVIAHENMIEVRKTTTDTTLDDYVFYQSSDLSSEQSVHDFDVTYPYLQFGFGQPSTCSKKIGLAANSTKDADASIVKLGVVLIQVAARQSIPGIHRKGSKIDASAQGLVEKTLEGIGVQFGDGLTNAIEACLMGNSQTEDELIRKTTGVLRQLQDTSLDSR